MQNREKIAGLIEKAAWTINLLNPNDNTEIAELHSIFSQINESVTQITDISSQLQEQIKSKSSDASQILQNILEDKIQDATEAIEMVTEIIIAVQKIIDQVANVIEQPTSRTVDTKQAVVLSEENMLLILDFIAEANEHIESAEIGLLELENKPNNTEVLNQIFRAFHSIKGTAGFFNLTEISLIAHSAENLLDMLRKGILALNSQNSELILVAIDMLKKMICDLKTSVKNSTPVPSYSELQQLLTRLKSIVEAPKATISANNISADTSMRRENIENISHKSDDQKIEQIITLEPNSDKPKNKSCDEHNCCKIADRRSGNERRTNEVEEKIKVSTTRLDNLVNMVGELVIAQLMVSEEIKLQTSSTNQLNHKIAHQSKIVRELQELSMSMRMVPISGVFQKMTRLVRDLSHKGDKKVNLITRGDDTELDRTIVDKISDPLVHMMRNSIDHGIELPQERIQAGKDPTGKIELRAYHQAGYIIIEVEDDGKGLDAQKILKKAVESSLVTSDQQLSEQEIFKLIFNAGLSTAEKVTSISGRGVGMDVVKKNIDSLRGKIEINSTAGKGTTFTIKMPLTLAVIDGQITKVGNERYIVPTNSILSSFRPTETQVSTMQGKGEMVMIRQGEILPLIRLHKLFNITNALSDTTKALLVMVEEDNKRCCLLVDDLLGQQQVVIKNLGEGLGRVKGISGGAIMGDGKVSMILDIKGVMELARK